MLTVTLISIMLSDKMLSFVMLSVFHTDSRNYAYFAECCYAECHYAECHVSMLSVIMLIVIMLNTIC
jgi:hypothetical protein